jgi:hypothetical protein
MVLFFFRDRTGATKVIDVIATTASGHRVLDPWLALLAGERVWSEHDETSPDTRRRAAGGLEVVALAFVVSLMWVVVVERLGAGRETTRTVVPAVAATLAGATLAVGPTRMLVGRLGAPAPFLRSLLWRGVAFLVLIVSIAAHMPGWPAVAAWAVGIVVGADVMMSTWSLGLTTNPLRWWRHFMLSPLHFGVIGALVAVAVVPGYLPRLESLVGPYVALHVGLLVAVLTAMALIAIADQLRLEFDGARALAAVQERRHRAHWLHDDVLAEVRITTLRLQGGTRSTEQVVADLEELDHRLRVRQLDELYAAGDTRLADIMQPHVRRAQTLGVRFTAMPSFDAAGHRVDEQTGRMFGRAVSVLLSNAVNAGATSLALGLEIDDEVVIVRLADNAGGFDLDEVPAGRGLDSLADDLGRRNVQRIGLPGGSLMIVTIPVAHRPAERRPPWEETLDALEHLARR